MKTLSYSEIIGRENVRFLPNSDFLSKRRGEQKENHDIFDLIWRGSYPQLLQDERISKDVFHSSYIQTYIDRDVSQFAKVGSQMDFLKFIKVCAARNASMLNFSEISADAAIPIYQAKKWFSILLASDLVYTIEPYFDNRLKRAIKTPKFYFSDTGLCSYLASWNSARALEDGAMSGEYFENYAINEIIKSYSNCGVKPPLYYYRDKEKKEIDLIVESDGKLHPVEIKKTATPKKDMIKNFNVISPEMMGEGALVCRHSEDVPLTKDVSVLPVWYL